MLVDEWRGVGGWCYAFGHGPHLLGVSSQDGYGIHTSSLPSASIFLNINIKINPDWEGARPAADERPPLAIDDLTLIYQSKPVQSKSILSLTLRLTNPPLQRTPISGLSASGLAAHSSPHLLSITPIGANHSQQLPKSQSHARCSPPNSKDRTRMTTYPRRLAPVFSQPVQL